MERKEVGFLITYLITWGLLSRASIVHIDINHFLVNQSLQAHLGASQAQ